MGNRKIKLLASITSLILVFAVMAVGIWAAAGQTVNVTTSVSFTATGVSGTMQGTLTGVGGVTQYYNSTSSVAGPAYTFSPDETLTDWTLGSPTAIAIDGVDGEASALVYTLTITNASTTDAIIVNIADLTVGTNLGVVSVVQDAGAPITGIAGDYSLTNIAPSGSTVVVITIYVIDDSISITSADITYTVNLTSVNA
ncbi:MAG: hypothetical protein PHQ62_04175 [Clostridia bacterium]|nr:hypothetical protein [Clostridia bacterium]